MISDVLDGKIEYNPLSLETTTSPTVVKKLSGIISTNSKFTINCNSGMYIFAA